MSINLTWTQISFNPKDIIEWQSRYGFGTISTLISILKHIMPDDPECGRYSLSIYCEYLYVKPEMYDTAEQAKLDVLPFLTEIITKRSDEYKSFLNCLLEE